MKPQLRPLLGELSAYLQEKAGAQREAAQRSGKPVFDFGIGDPREPTPLFIREALKAAIPEVSQYPSVAGLPVLRKAAAGYLKRRFGLAVDPDHEILPCQGAKEALFHLPLCAVSRERPLCFFPDPAYPVYERGILFAGGEPRRLPLVEGRAFLPDLDAVPADDWQRTALFFDNYPHTPTGAAAPVAYHQKLLALAREHGFLAICDEPYVDLYAKDPPHTAYSVSRENVLVVHSLSKRSGMTGYRSGFMAGEPDLIAKLREARANFGVAPQSIVQQAAAVAWDDDAHVEARRSVFAQKRAVLAAHLKRVGLRTSGEGAFYLWVHVPEGETSESYAARLGERNILVVPGPSFGPSGKGFIRLAMVPTVEDCKRAVEVWPA
jgi:succinyldiaminopimelate transaminase